MLIKEMIQIVELQDVENTLRKKFEVQLGETESEHQRKLREHDRRYEL